MIKDAFLQSLVQINCIPVLIIVFLFFFLKSNYIYEKELTKKFIPSVILLLALIVVDNLDYYAYDTFLNTGIPDLVHRMFSMLGYDIRIILMASLVSIASSRIIGHKNTVLVTYLPSLINVAVLIPCLFTDLFFYFKEDGTIGRGIFAYESHLLSAVYLMFLFALAFLSRKNGMSEEMGILLLCGVLSFMGFLAEFLFSLRGILIGVVALDIVFYYLHLHIDHFRFDPLTEILNRESFNADIERFGRSSISHLMSIDLNDLKKINDTLGHNEGDTALKATAHALKRSCLPNCYIYRVGGDEFSAICLNKSDEDVREMSEKMQKAVKKAGYVCAIGYSAWETDKSFTEVYKEADDRMYDNKRALKAVRA